MLTDLLSSIETWPLAAHIGETWWFPLLESIHVLTGTFLVGSILMVDLRLLGLAGRHYLVTRLTQEIVPWTLGACAISVVCGLGLFITRASHYASNPAFLAKIVLLALAGVNMAAYHLVSARAFDSDAPPATTPASRLAGAASMALWAGVLLAGRWTGHLN